MDKNAKVKKKRMIKGQNIFNRKQAEINTQTHEEILALTQINVMLNRYVDPSKRYSAPGFYAIRACMYRGLRKPKNLSFDRLGFKIANFVPFKRASLIR
jgi:hypothetical protein